MALLLGIIALPIRSHIETIGNEETIEKLRTQLDTADQKLVENDIVRKKIIEYGDVAKLNAFGETGLAGRGLTENRPIKSKVELIWIREENSETRHPKCDKEGLEKAKLIVEEHPRFPFSYYVLAVCHRSKGGREWIAYSQRALDILEFTTQVPGHHHHHDTVKKQLDDWMREAQDNLQNQ